MLSIPLLRRLAGVTVPHQAARAPYPLPESMALTFAASIAGADDLVETVRRGVEHLDFLRQSKPHENSRPVSEHRCRRPNLSDVFRAPKVVINSQAMTSASSTTFVVASSSANLSMVRGLDQKCALHL
jgi:hypothetical protein